MTRKGVQLPNIEISNYCDDFEMPPLETMSPFDFMAPLKEDDSVFFMGSITGYSLSDQRTILPVNPKYDDRLFVELPF